MILDSQYINNKTWILFAMGAYSFDEAKFTSVREEKKKKKKKKNRKQ